jgi:hypothetical protein
VLRRKVGHADRDSKKKKGEVVLRSPLMNRPIGVERRQRRLTPHQCNVAGQGVRKTNAYFEEKRQFPVRYTVAIQSQAFFSFSLHLELRAEPTWHSPPITLAGPKSVRLGLAQEPVHTPFQTRRKIAAAVGSAASALAQTLAWMTPCIPRDLANASKRGLRCERFCSFNLSVRWSN